MATAVRERPAPPPSSATPPPSPPEQRLSATIEAGAEFAVILMSAAGCKTANGTGRDAFLAKPFELDELEALVQRWLRRDSHQDEPTR